MCMPANRGFKNMNERPLFEDPLVIVDAVLATMRECEEDDFGYGYVRNGALVIDQGRIIWVGRKDDIPDRARHLPAWSAGNRLITPGLIDCHTHLIFGGDRRIEFALRAQGENYTDLVWKGHGINSTVVSTRGATHADLLQSALRRLRWSVSGGVTTIEVKSGYGLDVDTELKMLRVGRELQSHGLARVETTLLAGHIYLPGVDPESYIDTVCTHLIPQAADEGLCDAVEVYCEESIGFSLDDASTILETAYRRKIPTRILADHLSDSAGAALAPAFYARAAAHLNFTDDVSVAALSSANTTAILLPIAFIEDGSKQKPPIERLRECGVSIAIATGCNPGLAPTTSILAAAHCACVSFGLSPLEAMRGITVCAARALGLTGTVGELIPGASADLAIWDAEHPEELIYWLGAPLCHSTWLGGKRVRQPELQRDFVT
ncbi:Imidazolonepropionase [Hyphomicrobium sp. 1Nfss2.1]